MTTEELATRFKYSAPNADHRDKFERLTTHWAETAELINELCPDSHEKDLAFDHLDITRFFANGAIVRRS